MTQRPVPVNAPVLDGILYGALGLWALKRGVWRQGGPKDDITKHGQAQMRGAGLVVTAERRARGPQTHCWPFLVPEVERTHDHYDLCSFVPA